MYELYKFDVMHRDIKPANILMSEPSFDATLKLCDFGMARYLEKKLLTEFEEDCEYKVVNSMIGTPLYMAPEIKSK